MTDPQHPEDPIWSRWRERHAPGNGAPRPEAPPEPPPEPERIRLGDPLDPNWAEGAQAHRDPLDTGPEPQARATQQPPGAQAEHECLEWCPICRTADVVRASFPPEVRSQLEGVQRDAIIAMRTVLDHYLERLDGHDRPASRVEDIPIS